MSVRRSGFRAAASKLGGKTGAWGMGVAASNSALRMCTRLVLRHAGVSSWLGIDLRRSVRLTWKSSPLHRASQSEGIPMQTFIERGEVIALDCSHQDTILFYDPSYGPYEKCVECEVVLDEEDAPADNDLTDAEAVADAGVWVAIWLSALAWAAVVGLGLVWWAVTA